MRNQVINLSNSDRGRRLTLLFEPPLVLTEGLGRWHCHLESGGIGTCDQIPSNTLHHHSCHELSLVIQGGGRFRHEDRQWTLRTGDVFLAEPGVAHEISSWKTRDLLFIYYQFAIQETATPCDDTCGEEGIWTAFARKHRQHAPVHPAALAYFRQLEARAGRMPDHLRRLHLRTLFYELIGGLVDGGTSATAVPGGSDLVERALRFIGRHFQRNPPVQELAAALGTTARTLQRGFKRRLGQPVHQTLIQKRMEWAARRLTMGLRVREVADELHFPTAEQFSTAFKAYWGQEPSRFRKRHLPGVLLRATRW